MKLKMSVSMVNNLSKKVIPKTVTIIQGYRIPDTKNVKVLIEFDLRYVPRKTLN
jgi:hypothetical protein